MFDLANTGITEVLAVEGNATVSAVGSAAQLAPWSMRQDEIDEADYFAVDRDVLTFAGVDPQPRSATAWPGPRLSRSSSRSACSADSGAFHRIRAYNAASGSSRSPGEAGLPCSLVSAMTAIIPYVTTSYATMERVPAPPESSDGSADQAVANDYDGFAAAYTAETEANLINGYYARPAIVDLAGDVAGRRTARTRRPRPVPGRARGQAEVPWLRVLRPGGRLAAARCRAGFGRTR